MRSLIRLTMLSGAGALAAMLAASAANAAVTISTAATSNMSCTGGVCMPTAKNAVLNVGDLMNMLANGNVTVNTGTGSLPQKVEDIIVAAPFNWASANALMLDAYDSVTVNQPVAVNGTGAVVLTTNDGGKGKGHLSFGANGNWSFLGTANSVTINGVLYTLVNSLPSLASAVNASPSGNYALASDYDASQDGRYSNAPIAALTGTVQGLGNTISNLPIKTKSPTLVGVFASNSGLIENLHLSKINYKDRRSEGAYAGGMVAQNFGTLFGDRVDGTIGKAYLSGGLVAVNEPGALVLSSAANVGLKADYSGGLVGDNEGSISLSSASGTVRGLSAGGLVGNDGGSIDQSYATGDVVPGGAGAGGGLIGFVSGEAAAVSNSYSTGTVGDFRGGFFGGFYGNTINSDNITTSYSSGALPDGGGGFECKPEGGNDSNDYWDTTTSGTTDGVCGGNVAGLTGLTTQQIQSGLPTGFDPKIWAESPSINNGFPYLIANPPQ